MSDLVYGVHAVESLIKANQAKELFILQKQNLNPKLSQIMDDAKALSIEVTFLNSVKDLPCRIKKDANHQNIFAIEKITLKTYIESDIPNLLLESSKPFILVLDSVQDPHNFGACIRSAHSAGVDFIVVPKDNSAPVNATVKKVACGAAEHTKIVVVTNLARAIEKLKEQGVWVIGLAGEASDSLYDMNLNDPIAIVAGAEGSGMRQLTKTSCDFLAKLPMFGKVSSLNVSVATGIALYETVRQRG
ncbi:23S rRNA (guanosine(2251)-2'-O)-methyltransferase RlmB [Allofrancisella guangzhouensis]|uniref:RNA methyltransferase n=1 Tax=Allofrancisella guangzhouensis TaxID=594679 RepID=A0A0A8E6I9_9GAMM|nr:23S rRNA (guanosine(2251)-2'-O)-methyltransferase RlmB [Allofrancisella guangzhouensis]AJC49212.1 RNA methyltransferase [Allofrancisella guangzhouensis]MBK2027590.1 23S rRNA (guanosine(2251)-2'-O)-methyltransferase RlmB [Allofrancisella guangzhouensis]MBK2044821.1 23S rRNA (guanosine(2251)-2'-O)-methyltransferase RlmB [Allofrancisella guangzhouensis]MBK2045025.1 23S rRNA (guanosine(2251)-2'-O)-methyltransferase RlmB [Allofrancisella guangzhouensis]